ncbi:hypothetical protein ACJ72_00217 [Emergomyces africanus]|uniref:Uncharacterized protein n=1 Tax=Emergomyces africanus TaxID=1955775 RepID=A0A1B7P8Q6_9EURO|nr:hypothetical protein ACJ72_00217 [Emergomyces africanus]
MKLLTFTTLLGIAAGAAVTTSSQVDRIGVDNVLLNLKSHRTGFTHVGNDGVVRSYNGKGEVIDAARLTPQQLVAVAQEAPSADEKKHLLDVWANVDSSKVNETQMWNPPQHVLPSRFSNPKEKVDVDVDDEALALEKARYDAKDRLQRRFPFCNYVKCQFAFQCEFFFTCGPCIGASIGNEGHCWQPTSNSNL